jgi:eukaryotic-like serine/threonine-protein kinase
MRWPIPLTGSDPKLERRVLDLFQVLLDLPSGERVAWIEAHSDIDSPLRSRLMAMLAGDRLANLRTGGAGDMIDDERLPERIGAYRITDLIGQGGMGAVYRGERMTGDFDHVAAIKLIRPGALSDALVERFQRERQTLASLAHPNIARLFDGGATDKGDPYIVMEYVDGVPLGTWIETGAASTAERTTLFLDICSAVGFAHQNLIVHRDITPSNILVAKDGTAKLIDFGIARPPVADIEAPPSAKKSLAGLSLTPGYAAPERVAGEAATTLSDVYSLGILLDRLIEKDADLAAIIAQASALDPANRYPSVDALADDVKAWRDGRMVAARKGGRRYAVGKFVGRHKLGVGGSVIAVLLLIGALVTTLIANSRAQAARIEAESRFAQTRSIAKTMMFDAYDQVSRLPGAIRARQTLAATSLKYLDTLSTNPDAPFQIRVETAEGYARLADVIGTGLSGTLGKLADGNALLAKSERILSRAHAERPDDNSAKRAYAALLTKKASIDLYNNNDVTGARAGALRARDLISNIATRDVETARIYAASLQIVADTWGWSDDWARAKAGHLDAERFAASLPDAMQHDPKIMMVRSGNLRLLGEAHHRLKENSDARVILDRAVAINDTLLAIDPSDPITRRKVATSNWFRAVVHRTNKRDALAVQSIERAVSAATALRDFDRDDAASAELWLVTSEVQAQIFMDLGRRRDAYDVHQELVTEYRRLVLLSGKAAGMRRKFSTALETIGGNYYNGGDYLLACQAWAESRALLTWLEANKSMSDYDRRNLLPRVTELIAKSCNPPRQGLGPKL